MNAIWNSFFLCLLFGCALLPEIYIFRRFFIRMFFWNYRILFYELLSALAGYLFYFNRQLWHEIYCFVRYFQNDYSCLTNLLFKLFLCTHETICWPEANNGACNTYFIRGRVYVYIMYLYITYVFCVWWIGNGWWNDVY